MVAPSDVLQGIEGGLKAVLKAVDGVEVCALGGELLQLAAQGGSPCFVH